MQIQQMRYVLAAAEKKSFSAAAKALFLSSPLFPSRSSTWKRSLAFPSLYATPSPSP